MATSCWRQIKPPSSFLMVSFTSLCRITSHISDTLVKKPFRVWGGKSVTNLLLLTSNSINCHAYWWFETVVLLVFGKMQLTTFTSRFIVRGILKVFGSLYVSIPVPCSSNGMSMVIVLGRELGSILVLHLGRLTTLRGTEVVLSSFAFL